MLDIARAKFQVLPRAAVGHREAGVDLAPGLLVDNVDVLSAEDPAEAQRRRIAGRERHGVVGRAEIEVRPAANTVHLPSRAVTDARGGLGHVLRRGLAMPLRVPDLRGEVQPVADVVGTVEVDKTRVRALIGARDLVIDAVSRSRDRREGRLG